MQWKTGTTSSESCTRSDRFESGDNRVTRDPKPNDPLAIAVGGVSVFSLGISFNYLVALFHRKPIRQENLLERIVGPSPQRHFGWIGLALAGGGVALGSLSLVLGLQGWEITRLWLWQLGSALFLLVGAQFMLFWLLIRVIAALSHRDEGIGSDLMGREAVQPVALRHSAAGAGTSAPGTILKPHEDNLESN